VRMGMTVPQKKYFIKRIDEVLMAKVSELNKQRLHQDSSSDLNDFQEALARGVLTLEGIEQIQAACIKYFTSKSFYSFGLSSAIPIEKVVKDLDLWFKSRDMARDDINLKLSHEETRLREEATRIQDVAMFGNEQEAHEALRQFENFGTNQEGS